MPTTFSTGHLLICEGESGQLRCNKEGKINILSANYGRLDSHSCPHWMTTDTNCHSGNSLAQVQQICQSNSTCELEATNVFFGDLISDDPKSVTNLPPLPEWRGILLLLYLKIGNCEEELPKKPVGRLSVNCRPTGYRQSTDSQPTGY